MKNNVKLCFIKAVVHEKMSMLGKYIYITKCDIQFQPSLSLKYQLSKETRIGQIAQKINNFNGMKKILKKNIKK